jgi:hypothetical protein
MDFREGDAVGDDRLAEQLVGIGHVLGRVQQVIIAAEPERPRPSLG